jgi:hypothetical protein
MPVIFFLSNEYTTCKECGLQSRIEQLSLACSEFLSKTDTVLKADYCRGLMFVKSRRLKKTTA